MGDIEIEAKTPYGTMRRIVFHPKHFIEALLDRTNLLQRAKIEKHVLTIDEWNYTKCKQVV
jgi:hypothetical protein